MFTGKRQIPGPAPEMAPPPGSRTVPRLAARLQYNVFDAENGFFYAGTYGGARRILAFGAGVDKQDAYTAYAVDGFFDWPVGRDVVTAQAVFATNRWRSSITEPC